MSADANDDLARGRAAFARADWHSSFDLLSRADSTSPLSARDLAAAAESAMWVGEFERCVELRRRAFAAFVDGGDHPAAAQQAIELCMDNAHRHRMAVAIGWIAQAERLLERCEPCTALGLLTVLRAVIALDEDHDVDVAAAHYEEAIRIGRSCGDADVVALGLVGAGTVLVRRGEVARGMRLVDEAMTDAVSGRLTPLGTARIYCGTISLCQALGDARRASEWTEQALACGAHPGMAGYPGDCRLHRAEITRVQGRWSDAETQVHDAMRELERWDLSHLGHGWHELGELAVLRGDLDAAEHAFARAAELGKDPEPGLARLRLAQGQCAEASALLRAAVGSVPDTDLLALGPLLPVLVEALLACGELDAARAAADRLDELATRYPTVVLMAQRSTGRARVALAAGEPRDVVTTARAAIALWRDAAAPYEVARAQVLVAQASLRTGDEPMAMIELDAAISSFRSLGATTDLQAATGLRDRIGDCTAGQPVRRTFMFTDIVDSTPLVAAMGDERWASVLHWHDRTMRELLAEHSGLEVKQRHGGDGFFAVFATPSAAITCAIAMQRRFEQHRMSHGFAPDLRIGVHEADALLSDNDFAGLGVHEAARIAAVAGAGEIVTSATTASSGGVSDGSPVREVELKGLRDRMAVTTIRWEPTRTAGTDA